MGKPVDRSAAILNTEIVALIPWIEQRDEIFGYDLRSGYVEQFWLATLGPSTTWFLRHCVSLLEGIPGTSVNLRETAAALGIGSQGGARSAMAKTVIRACRFRAARQVGAATLAIRTRLPELSHRQLTRLPVELRQRHVDYMATQPEEEPEVHYRQGQARLLAASLIRSGDDLTEAETKLSRLEFPPLVAAEAARWAWHNHHETPPTAA